MPLPAWKSTESAPADAAAQDNGSCCGGLQPPGARPTAWQNVKQFKPQDDIAVVRVRNMIAEEFAQDWRWQKELSVLKCQVDTVNPQNQNRP